MAIISLEIPATRKRRTVDCDPFVNVDVFRNSDDILEMAIHERGGDEGAVEIQSILAYGWILRLSLRSGLSWMHPVVFVCAGGVTRSVRLGREQPA